MTDVEVPFIGIIWNILGKETKSNIYAQHLLVHIKVQKVSHVYSSCIEKTDFINRDNKAIETEHAIDDLLIFVCNVFSFLWLRVNRQVMLLPLISFTMNEEDQ